MSRPIPPPRFDLFLDGNFREMLERERGEFKERALLATALVHALASGGDTASFAACTLGLLPECREIVGFFHGEGALTRRTELARATLVNIRIEADSRGAVDVKMEFRMAQVGPPIWEIMFRVEKKRGVRILIRPL